MAGIYVHIPFCKSRCAYCGFYSTTQLTAQQRYVDALCREYELRRHTIELPPSTIYIGGGTPSTLSAPFLEQLFEKLGSADEVTLECNPDDVTADFASSLRHLPVNRVSMGAQTFSDERLRFIGRRHNAAQVATAVERLRHVGIGNISIDLIYGFPDETLSDWQQDISTALDLNPEHLSAYALSYEEGTPLYRLLEQGRIAEADEELSRAMYYSLLDTLAASGYEHYEISNFARPGYHSRHNSSYWNHSPYLGLGAAAHSFDGKRRRQWNVADIAAYIDGVENGRMLTEGETLDDDTLYNELVMTALRTAKGLDLSLLSDSHRSSCIKMARRHIDAGLLTFTCEKDAALLTTSHGKNAATLTTDHGTGRLRLTRDALFVSDMVMADLMLPV